MKYFDRLENEITAGAHIRCVLNGEVETVITNGDDLGIAGYFEDSFHSLANFVYECCPADHPVLENFEIVS